MATSPRNNLYLRLSQRFERRLGLLNDGVKEEDLAKACRQRRPKNESQGLGDSLKPDESASSTGRRGSILSHPQREWTSKSSDSWAPSGRLGCAAVATDGCLFVFGGIGNGSSRVQSGSGRMYNANTAIYEVARNTWVQVPAHAHKLAQSNTPGTIAVVNPVPGESESTTKVHKGLPAGKRRASRPGSDSPAAGSSVHSKGEAELTSETPTNNDATPAKGAKKSIFAQRAEGGISLGAGGEMNNVPRAGMTANLLDDGKIVIFGGESGFKTTARQVYNNVFLFDVRDRMYAQLHPKGLLPRARRGHSAVLSSHMSESLRLVVFGGAGPSGVSKRDSYFNDVCVLDLDEKLWSKPTCTGVVPSPRFGHCAFHVPGLKYMYMWGGMSAEIVTVRGQPKMATAADARSELFEQDDEWTPFAAPVMYSLNLETFEWAVVDVTGSVSPEPRWGHTAVLCPTAPDTVFIFGGQTYSGAPSNDVLAFDTTSNTWHTVDTKGTLPSARYGHACDMFGSTMMVFGGCGRSSYCSTKVHCIRLPDTLNDPSIRKLETANNNNNSNNNSNNNNADYTPGTARGSIHEASSRSLMTSQASALTPERGLLRIPSGASRMGASGFALASQTQTGFEEGSTSSLGMLGSSLLQRPSTAEANLCSSLVVGGYQGIPMTEMPRPRSSPYESVTFNRQPSKRGIGQSNSTFLKASMSQIDEREVHGVDSFEDVDDFSRRRGGGGGGQGQMGCSSGGLGSGGSRRVSSSGAGVRSAGRVDADPWWLSQLANSADSSFETEGTTSSKRQQPVSTRVLRTDRSDMSTQQHRHGASRDSQQDQQPGDWLPLAESSWARRCVTAPAARSSALQARRSATLQTMESVLHGYNLDFADSRARLRRLNVNSAPNARVKNEIAEIRELFDDKPEVTSALAMAAAMAARRGISSSDAQGKQGQHPGNSADDQAVECDNSAAQVAAEEEAEAAEVRNNPALSRFVFKSQANGGNAPRTPGRAGVRFTISSAMRPISPAGVLYSEVQRLPRVRSALSRPLTRRPVRR